MSSLLRQIERSYWERNQLHALAIELTHRCCCRCRHCYVIHSPQDDELTTEEVRDLLDQARQEGVFHLSLTGGEPFLRPDLPAILDHAREHRFFVTLLTSGLLIDADQADMLAAHRPYSVEMSLLGATDTVNDDLMQVPGALARIRRAAALLRERGVPVTLKSTIMRPNVDDLEAMRGLARDLDCAYNASPMVAPRRDGGQEPMALALDEDALAAIDPQELRHGPLPGEDYEGGAVLVCKAGRTSACVSAGGEVYPCLMWPQSVGNIRQRSLQSIWHDDPAPWLLELRSLRDEDLEACAACELRRDCHRCPGLAWQENGSFAGPAPSICMAARGYQRSRLDRS
jgi:pyrroloquinoline quinone biosynthesis protein E